MLLFRRVLSNENKLSVNDPRDVVAISDFMFCPEEVAKECVKGASLAK